MAEQSTTAAKPAGSCHRCGGQLYEYLIHHCPTAVTNTAWTTGESPRTAHVCNCVGCCPACGSCRTSPLHTSGYCALLVRQAAERATWIAEREGASGG